MRLWTLSPPRLRNHRWQVLHCTAPRCSHTGFDRSSVHLCLFLSDSRLKDLLHTSQLIRLNWLAGSCCSSRSCCCWARVVSSPRLYLACHPPLERVASLYHHDSGTPTTLRSWRIWSLHRLRGPPGGRVWGSHPNRASLGVR